VSGPSARWRVEVGSCRLAGGDGILAEVDFGASRRRRPRAAAPPKPPKRCPYQRPGPGTRPPLARRAGRDGGRDHRAAGPATGAAAGALRRGRNALRPRRTSLAVILGAILIMRYVQTSATLGTTTDRALVTSRPAVRVRSSALFLRTGVQNPIRGRPAEVPGTFVGSHSMVVAVFSCISGTTWE
jgi:hypothetical protein